MASSPFKPVPIKRLAEFLQEQQEPYTLDMCISKRFLKNSRTDCGDSSNQNDLGEAFKRSCICNPMKRIRPPKSSRILKLITNRFISNRKCCSIHFTRNSRAQTEESAINLQLIRGTDCFSYSESSAEENFHCSALGKTFGALQAQNSEGITTKCQCRSMKASKQLILRLQQSAVASPLYKNMECPFITREEAEALSSGSPIMPIKATENSTFSDSPCNLPSLTKKQKCYSTPDSWDMSGFSKYVKDGTDLIQTKQLLLDYANEAINIHGKQGSGKSTKEMVVPDGLREIIYKQICLWRKQPGDHKKITQLIDSDISTLEEWSDFQQLNRDTEIEIGDSILDDIVTELINLNYRVEENHSCFIQQFATLYRKLFEEGK